MVLSGSLRMHLYWPSASKTLISRNASSGLVVDRDRINLRSLTPMDPIGPQHDVFAFLSDPATHGGAKVRRIDTHAAAVFLAGERVYKVKRAVKFPFLDYSTVEKRRIACESELEVNQPFAPDIYLRAVAITRETDGHLALGGAGQSIDYAVEMVRFDEDATLDRLADARNIDAALADALARAVVAAHAKAPVVEAEPWIGALADYVEQNDMAFREMPDLFATNDAAMLTEKSRAAFARLRPLLGMRGKFGLIRRGHGDLHLGNIALIGGKPVPFDAIEFDPLIASGDVLYDLAFLLMDLCERDLGEAANIVLNRYFAETRRDADLDALAALPLFMSLRAAIRAKVTAARLADANENKRAEITKAAATYFRLACELITPPAPTLVAVGGLSGTGKSVLARGIAPDLMPLPGAALLRSDVERKVMFGAPETEKLPAEAYTQEAGAHVYASLYDKVRRILAAGHSVVVDAVFARSEERAAIAQAAQGANFQGLFLTADLDTRLKRVGARRNDASDADEKIVAHQQGYDLGTVEWRQVDASGTPDDTLRHARAALRA
jgi:aminoglycoside phosphotransferase family enzyme/predicted kinase